MMPHMSFNWAKPKADSWQRRREAWLLAFFLGALVVLGVIEMNRIGIPGMRPLPPNIDSFTTDSSKCPSAMNYARKPVALSGTLQMTGSNTAELQCPWGSDLPHPWFKDAGMSVAVGLPPNTHLENGDHVEMTGTLSVAPRVGGTAQFDVTIAADAIHLAEEDSEPASNMGSTEVISAVAPYCFLLLIPLCVRSVIVLVSPGALDSAKHLCPWCRYDCRGSPLRCPECGSPVQAPNSRLNLDPRDRGL
jgi:hypothetical protein